MYDQEYAKVTITVETGSRTWTYTMPKVAGIEYETVMKEPEIDQFGKRVILQYKAPLLKKLVFSFKPEPVDGQYLTVVEKKTEPQPESE